MNKNETLLGKENPENRSKYNESYRNGIDQVTELGQKKDFEKLAKFLGLPIVVVKFSDECVQDGVRKGSVMLQGQPITCTHLTHMARVALAMKSYFPEDSPSRILAMVHDIKEEAASGKERKYLEADEALHTANVMSRIELLTEEIPDPSSIESARTSIPEDFDPTYVAKYRTFIKRLKIHWNEVGKVELCDRLEGASSFEYLNDPKYLHRKKQKALETFARIWATIMDVDGPIVEDIKNACRVWFDKFDVSEPEVETSSRYFL